MQSLLVDFIVFAVVMFFTPGPNNIMVLSSGLTYGFRRTLPHIAGVTFGVAFMVAAVGLGLGTIFSAYPVLQTVLNYAGVAYLIYLATMIAMSGPPKAGEEGERGRCRLPVGQRQGLGDGDGYDHGLCRDPPRSPLNIAIQTLLYLLLGVLSTATWTLFGSALRPVLKFEPGGRAFNALMALLLLASLAVLRDA